MSASADTGQAFDADDALHFGFEAEDTLSFSVDVAKREIVGLAVPYGVTTRKGGRSFQFSQGRFSPRETSRVKARMDHDPKQVVGKALELQDRPEGMWTRLSIARGPEGDRALSLAEDGVYDGLSIGVGPDAQWESRNGVQHLISGRLVEISLTPHPAFDDARVSSVAASADEGNTMPCATCGQNHAAGTPCATVPTAPVQFDATAITDAIAAGFASLAPAPAGPGRVVIPATGDGERFEVNEENPYRFDADTERFQPDAAFDFAADLHAYSRGDQAAEARIVEFLGEQFAVTAASTASLNPNRQRPDLYVDRREFQYPLWAAVRKETLPDATPLVLPKYNTSSGLIAAMSEGVEPSAGSFTTTDQTVTPTEVGGKVEITRKLWDQIGPRVSTEIFRKMTAGWYEMLEANIVATLDAVTPVGITLTTGGGTGGATASAELAAAFADLQIVRGGFSFDTFAAQIDLYKRLATAVTTTGEPLFPQISPNNRNGSSAPKYSRMNVHGADVFPEWALAATGIVAASSYLFDRSSVYAAASVPQRLDWNFGATVQSTTNIPQVSMVTIGIHGYAASAVLDLAGVREVIYDPA